MPVSPAPPYNPRMRRRTRVWALPLSLAATKGVSIDFLSCWYLDGSLPSVLPLLAYVFSGRSLPFRQRGYPIRRPVDRRSLAPPHGFSQLSASFLAWRLLGILHGPLFA